MRWCAVAAVIMMAGSGIANADATTSPVFGSGDQAPFQIAVDATTGQPLVQKVPASTGVAVAK